MINFQYFVNVYFYWLVYYFMRAICYSQKMNAPKRERRFERRQNAVSANLGEERWLEQGGARPFLTAAKAANGRPIPATRSRNVASWAAKGPFSVALELLREDGGFLRDPLRQSWRRNPSVKRS